MTPSESWRGSPTLGSFHTCLLSHQHKGSHTGLSGAVWQCQRSRKDWFNWLVAEWPLDLAWVHSPRKWARGQNCGIEKWLLEISEESWARGCYCSTCWYLSTQSLTSPSWSWTPCENFLSARIISVNLSWVLIFPTGEHQCFLSSLTLAIAFSPLALNLTTLTPVSKS